jgi:hypothetical protein
VGQKVMNAVADYFSNEYDEIFATGIRKKAIQA